MSFTRSLNAVLELRCILLSMEKSIGLDNLSDVEMDVLLSAHAVGSEPGARIASHEIREHPLAAALTKPTYHRVLRLLLQRGLLVKAQGSRSTYYVLNQEAVEKLAQSG